MMTAYDVKSARGEAESLFAKARRILAGEQAPPPAPVEPIDIKQGIGRALRAVRSVRSAEDDLMHLAARGVAVVEGTLVAIDAIEAALCEAHELLSHALAAAEVPARALCAQRFIDLVNRIDTIANGAVFEGINLINLGRDNIELVSPMGGRPRHAIGHIVLTSGERGLGLKLPKSAFKDDVEIEASGATLIRARARLIKAADTFVNQASCLEPYLTGTTAAA